ncbi:MAG: outer membrane protein assembly factor BamD, partial [Burkholderiales bacterium]
GRVMKGFFLVALTLVVCACGLLPEQQDDTAKLSAQQLYNRAKEHLDSDSYDEAIKNYALLESRYPYGRYAQQAQVDVAYAHYRNGDPAGAVAAAERFIKLHPNHPNVDYLYYLKGLANFNEDLGILAPISRQDPTERDPKAAREAFDAFKDMVTRYPESKYAKDARARMKYLVNALASHEVHVARYYLRRGALVAAVNRAQSVVGTYPQAPAAEEALAIMVKGYDTLGLNALRDDSLRVLQNNFSGSVYLSKPITHDATEWWKFWGEDQFLQFW